MGAGTNCPSCAKQNRPGLGPDRPALRQYEKNYISGRLPGTTTALIGGTCFDETAKKRQIWLRPIVLALFDYMFSILVAKSKAVKAFRQFLRHAPIDTISQ